MVTDKSQCGLCHATVSKAEIKDGLCEVCRLFLAREKEKPREYEPAYQHNKNILGTK